MTTPPPPGPPLPPRQGSAVGLPPTPEEKAWAWVAHAGSIVAAGVAMAFLAPLIIMLVKGNESPFVRRHAVESLNFQISTLIYAAISVVLVFVLVGFVLLAALAVFWLVCIVLATLNAANGEEYRYPLTIRLVS